MTLEQEAVFRYISDKILNTLSEVPYLVGISGKDAAGKTIFSDALAEYLKKRTDREIIRITMDDFMNPQVVRNTLSSSLAESAYRYTFDTVSFKTYVLEPLQPNGNGTYKTKVFDNATDMPNVGEDHHITPGAIIIIDGALLYKDNLADYFSLKLLLDVSDDTAMHRGIERDKARGKTLTDDQLRAYRSTYIACQAMYHQKDRPLERADIVINNNDYLRPQVVSY